MKWFEIILIILNTFCNLTGLEILNFKLLLIFLNNQKPIIPAYDGYLQTDFNTEYFK